LKEGKESRREFEDSEGDFEGLMERVPCSFEES
jgi:hypothetical protein